MTGEEKWFTYAVEQQKDFLWILNKTNNFYKVPWNQVL